jgi:hypothetical protein
MISKAGSQPPWKNITLLDLKKVRGVKKLRAKMTMKPAKFAAILSQYNLARWCL